MLKHTKTIKTGLIPQTYLNNSRGPIFCQVISTKFCSHPIPEDTEGNQKWKGAAPNLINNATMKIHLEGKCVNHSPTKSVEIIINKDSKSSKEEKACTKKYLIHLSTLVKTPRLRIKGIKLIRFTSNPTHAPSQVGEEIIKKTDSNKTKTNNNIEGINIIRIRIESINRV